MSPDPERRRRPSRARIARAVIAALCAVSLTLTPLIESSAGLAQSPPSSILLRPKPPPMNRKPTKAECVTALKLTRGFKKYADDHNIHIGPKRLKELNRKLKDGTLKPADLPNKIKKKIESFLHDESLKALEELCKNAK